MYSQNFLELSNSMKHTCHLLIFIKEKKNKHGNHCACIRVFIRDNDNIIIQIIIIHIHNTKYKLKKYFLFDLLICEIRKQIKYARFIFYFVHFVDN